MNNLAILRAKSNARYICRECGCTELIQGHHERPEDDSTIIVLCAGCHSKKHPNVPKALFFSKNKQPYWHNKSASSLAKEVGVHPRTVIRAAKRLKILPGELSPWDEELIKNNVRTKQSPLPGVIKIPRVMKLRNINTYGYFCSECATFWISLEDNHYCPCCSNEMNGGNIDK